MMHTAHTLGPVAGRRSATGVNAIGSAPGRSIRVLAGPCVAVLFGLLASGAAAAAEPGESAVEIVVTGSRLSSVNASSPSPVVVVDTEELLHQGTTRAEELLNTLPQVNSGLTLGANGVSVQPVTGTATADLRGIGAFRTLVLVNGRRTAPGDPSNPSADLNTIPTTLIKRVEVLTGGASAIYGSDAVAGVVNFILDTDFNGFKLEAEGGANRASNGRGDLQDVARASGVNPATGTSFDGRSVDVSAVFGRSLFDGRGHVTAFAGYRSVQGIAAASRDYSACALGETIAGTSYQCLLDPATAGGTFVPNGGLGTPLTLDTTNGHAFRPLAVPGDLFNSAPYQSLQRPDTRYNAGAFASYRFSEAAIVYTEAMYTKDTTSVRYDPVATTLNATFAANAVPSPLTYLPLFPISCSNPLLSSSQVNALCTNYGLQPTDTAQVGIGRRNVEGGQRTDEFRHESFRVVAGLKGEFSEQWSYDTSLVYGRVNGRETLSNDFSNARLTNALNVVSVGGAPTCQSVVDTTDPNCVPYNIFQVGGVTPAALRYISEGGQQSGFADRTILNAQLIGELAKYGIRSPFAHNAVSVATGAEYRTESLRYNPDTAYLTGDLLFTGGARPTHGSFHVSEVFAEAKLPLAEDRPFAKDLVLNLSDRYAHYTPQGNVNAYGFGLEWAPLAPVRLRGSVSRAVRAPNAYELFTPQYLVQTNFIDPCAGPASGIAFSPAQCALTHVTGAEYGNIPSQSTVNVLQGGNSKLKPEIANTVTMGFVLTPVPNALFSADYWRIKVKQYVGNTGPGTSIAQCISTGNPLYCDLIQRDAINGSLSIGNGPTAGRVIGTRINTGSYGNSGLDFEGRYSASLDALRQKAGTLTFSFTGSAALDNPINVLPGTPALDCTGLYGQTCSGSGPTSPVPRWRHRLRTTWRTAHDFELSLNWRHIGAMKTEFASVYLAGNGPVLPVDSHISAYNYLDLDGGIDVTPHLNVRVGINNLTDKRPPVIGFAANPLLVNGNMAAGVYDPLGRFLFVGLTAKY